MYCTVSKASQCTSAATASCSFSTWSFSATLHRRPPVLRLKYRLSRVFILILEERAGEPGAKGQQGMRAIRPTTAITTTTQDGG